MFNLTLVSQTYVGLLKNPNNFLAAMSLCQDLCGSVLLAKPLRMTGLVVFGYFENYGNLLFCLKLQSKLIPTQIITEFN